jgi:hypothetical protein
VRDEAGIDEEVDVGAALETITGETVVNAEANEVEDKDAPRRLPRRPVPGAMFPGVRDAVVVLVEGGESKDKVREELVPAVSS